MLEIPFPLETVPSTSVETALETLRRDTPGVTPILLGDADVFSTEWAESVDAFDPPEDILAEARALDVDAWFENRKTTFAESDAQMNRSFRSFNQLYRLVAFPIDLALLPIRLVRWPLTGQKPAFLSRSPFDFGPDYAEDIAHGIEALKSQLAELEASGESTEEELSDIRTIIAELEADGNTMIFPDPVDYVTPRHGAEIAAGLVTADQPWESAAWLQHGTYALCAPKPVFVAQCRWMWEKFGARPITASTDHIGFELNQPIETDADAKDVLRRFALLGATEINADHFGSSGASLIDAPRLWVWWD